MYKTTELYYNLFVYLKSFKELFLRVAIGYFPIADAKVRTFFKPASILPNFFNKNFQKLFKRLIINKQ